MKKLVGIYKCRHCNGLNEIDAVEGAIPEDSFEGAFNHKLFTLDEDTRAVKTWLTKNSEFKMVILNRCNQCQSSVVILDLVKISPEDVII